MKATVEEINSVQRRLKVVVSSEAVNKAFDNAYLKIKKKAKVQGFRPGKAPIHILKKLYGASVSYEVGEQLINDNVFAAMNQQGVNPVASPFLEVQNTPITDSDYEFSFVVDVMPRIEIKDEHKGLQVECKQYEASEATLEKELKSLCRKHAKTSPIEDETTTIGEGHLLILSQEASIDGQTLEALTVKSAPVAIGRDDIFPELETAIVGMKNGETKQVDIKIPADFHDKEVAGKVAKFNIAIEGLYNIDIPELNDDFAKDNNFDSLDELKAALRTRLDETAEKMNKQELEAKLLESLTQRVAFEVPPAMVDQVIDSTIKGLQFNDQKALDKALANESFRSEVKPEAKVKVRNTIVLWEVIKNEKLEVSADELKEHLRKFAQASDENIEEQITSTIAKFGDRIKENLLFEKAVNFLAANAKINRESVVL